MICWSCDYYIQSIVQGAISNNICFAVTIQFSFAWQQKELGHQDSAGANIFVIYMSDGQSYKTKSKNFWHFVDIIMTVFSLIIISKLCYHVYNAGDQILCLMDQSSL